MARSKERPGAIQRHDKAGLIRGLLWYGAHGGEPAPAIEPTTGSHILPPRLSAVGRVSSYLPEPLAKGGRYSNTTE